MENRFKTFMTYFFLIVGGLIMIFPFFWMISSSLKTPAEYASYPPQWFPSNWFNFENFKEAFAAAPFARYFVNSVIVTTSSVLLTGFTTILGAFAFSRLRFPGREVIFSLLLSLMMVPFEMLVITNYQTVTKWGLVDTLPVLVIPITTSLS